MAEAGCAPLAQSGWRIRLARPDDAASLERLAAGAANDRALAFYTRHGYLHEDVRLAKPLGQ